MERIAASAAVLDYLHQTNSLCMVASHDLELTKILEKQYDMFYFCEQVTENGIEFDYRLKQGVAQTQNAIKLLDYYQFDKDIIEKANHHMKQYISSGKWE